MKRALGLAAAAPPSQRPSVVKIRTRLLHIWSVDAISETFCVELLVVYQWKCPPSHAEESLRDGAETLYSKWEPEWVPEIGLWGMIEQLFESERHYYSEVDPETGDVLINGRTRFAARVAETFELETYPFDVQDLNVRICVYNVLKMEPLPNDDGDAVLVELAGITLPDFKLIETLPAMWKITASNPEHHAPPSLLVTSWYRRRSTFHRWNGLFPLLFINICGICTWAVHWRQVDARLGLDVTLLLVAVSFKTSLASLTPPVGYLTMMDVYNIMSIGYLALATGLHVSFGFMYKDCDTLSGDCEFYAGGFAWMENAYTMDNVTLHVFWAVQSDHVVVSTRCPNPRNSEFIAE